MTDFLLDEDATAADPPVRKIDFTMNVGAGRAGYFMRDVPDAAYFDQTTGNDGRRMEMTDLVRFVDNHLEFDCDHAHTVIEPWGPDSFRVRTTPEGSRQKSDWALNIPQKACVCTGGVSETAAFIRNGTLEARVENTRVQKCRISFWRVSGGEAKLLLAEKDYIVWANTAPSRCFRPVGDGLYRAELHFEGTEQEKLFGMGENETDTVNLKGSVIDLYQRHIKASIPFVLSSLGYGFLWNNPSLGRVEFSHNRTRWVSYGCRQTDYYITTGASYAQIMSHYIDAVGHAPKFPYWASGFWQCKLRYKTQEEFLSVAREFKRRKLPVSVLVIDYYHWDVIGNWRFDEACWPDPQAMCDEMKELGIRIMISPWTLLSKESIHYPYMKEHGLLTGSVDGEHDEVELDGVMCAQYDPTNPEAADYLWEQWKRSYVDRGITTFWLDPCDEFHPIDEYDLVTYSVGKALECHSVFVVAHQKNIYDRLRACGEEEIVNICRNAWVGSWRYGACPAPHDIECSFRHLKAYFKAGLNMMVSGTPWWNCDIGGFITDDNSSGEFHELMIRWYQWGVFMPVFRTHGNRENNEPWTVGGNTYPYLRAQILLREALRPYVMEQMDEASRSGLPPARPLYFDYQEDETAYEQEDELLFGADLLAAPVLDYLVRERDVYLPGTVRWADAYTGELYAGGQTVRCPAPLDRIPVFVRADSGKAGELLEIFRNYSVEM